MTFLVQVPASLNDRTIWTCKADLVAISRPFIANPDLVDRVRQGLPLAEPDPATFYASEPTGFADGSTDYPLAPARPDGEAHLGMSRVFLGVHYPGDVLVGQLLAALTYLALPARI